MAFVCWLALLAPGVAPPPAGRTFHDDPSLPYPLDALTPEGGGGYDGCQDLSGFQHRKPAPYSGFCGCGYICTCEQRRDGFEKALAALGFRWPAGSLWIGLSHTDLPVVRKRIQSILASDRLEHHKREEIARLIKLGMSARQVRYLLAG